MDPNTSNSNLGPRKTFIRTEHPAYRPNDEEERSQLHEAIGRLEVVPNLVGNSLVR